MSGDVRLSTRTNNKNTTQDDYKIILRGFSNLLTGHS